MEMNISWTDFDKYLAHRNLINDRIYHLKEKKGKTSQVEYETRIIEDIVHEPTVELLRVKDDSEVPIDSLEMDVTIAEDEKRDDTSAVFEGDAGVSNIEDTTKGKGIIFKLSEYSWYLI